VVARHTPHIPGHAFKRKGVLLNRFYFARKGDTSKSVATLLYGSPNDAHKLMAWNSGSWKPGKLIYYQSPTDAKDKKMRSFYQERSIPVEEYVATASDTLARIATKKLGAAGSWKEIAVVNGLEAFEEWAKKGVLLLMSDSTNAERGGHTISENDITHSFEGIFGNQTSRLFIALFASNIRRIENFLRIAHQLGKKVAFAGRSMHSYTRLAHEQKSLKIPEDTVVLLENLERYPDDKVIILATGSQAEPGSALVRIAHGNHKEITIRSGDQVILSSRFIPGNERNITSMIDQLYRAGAEVMYEAVHQIHVSGHGFQDELVLMLKAVNPKYFVPIHGEYRHLKKHAMLAKKVGVASDNIHVIEDGQSLEIDKKGIRLGEKRELRKTAIVERDLLQSEAETFAQRIALSKTGVVCCAVLRDAKTRRLIAHPRMAYYGLLFRKGEDPDEVLEGAIHRLEKVHDEFAKSDDLPDRVRLELRRYFKKRVSHKPLVIPFILDV